MTNLESANGQGDEDAGDQVRVEVGPRTGADRHDQLRAASGLHVPDRVGQGLFRRVGEKGLRHDRRGVYRR
jgi:hypothetical protein